MWAALNVESAGTAVVVGVVRCQRLKVEGGRLELGLGVEVSGAGSSWHLT